MAIKLTIHGVGSGICALTGKDTDGMTVSFEDGTLHEGFLSQRAFLQLLKMKFAQAGKPNTKPGTVPVAGPVKS
jgi:hypothetical protein